MTIPAAEKDRLLLQLLHEKLRGDVRARETLAGWLSEHAIKYEKMSF